MNTLYDWMTMALFATLVVIFLQRSTDDAPAHDRMWHYAPPALGCALCDQIGNTGLSTGSLATQILAFLGLGAIVAYSYIVLRIRPI